MASSLLRAFSGLRSIRPSACFPRDSRAYASFFKVQTSKSRPAFPCSVSAKFGSVHCASTVSSGETMSTSSAQFMSHHEPVVSSDWLHANLQQPDVKVLDASWYMPDEQRNPFQEYQVAHIPGAVFFDVDGISDRTSNLPHMLPSEQAFGAAVSALGIHNEDGVIVYDGKGIFSAARVWWMFRVFGHDKVWVLDGGLPQWRASGYDVESSASGDSILKASAASEAIEKVYHGQSVSPVTFQARLQPHLVWTHEQVKQNIDAQTHQHVDARSKPRFDGAVPEPRKGIRGGHVPGSKCIPFGQEEIKLMAFSRKGISIAISGYIHADWKLMRIWKFSMSSLSRFNSAWENDSFWLGRLDHKDWLAPSEVLKVFNHVRDHELIIGAFSKVSNRIDYKPSEALYSLLIDRLACARKFDAFEDLLERAKCEKCRLSDEFFYKLIKIYGNVANHIDKAVAALLRMPEFHCWPTVKTFNYVLNLLVNTRQYEVVHDVYLSAPRLGITVDTCCFNILIKGLCQWDKLDDAFSLLHEMPKQGCRPNKKTYATLMHFLCKHGRTDEAFELCERMERDGCYPDTITFNILISGLCKEGRVDEGMGFLKKMKLRGCYPNSGTYQALLYGLLGSSKFVEAKDVMYMMISEEKFPSLLSYKLIIDGLCNENLINDVVLVLNQMVSQGFVPRMGTWKRILECML